MRNAAVISVYEIRPNKGLIVNAVVPPTYTASLP